MLLTWISGSSFYIGNGGLALPIRILSTKIDKKLLFDRIDAIASVFLAFVVLSLPEFTTILNELLIQASSQNRTVLMSYLQTLLSDRQVQLNTLNKKNRMLFIQNFRDFYQQIKHLTIY
jgi:hypothetical protein